MILIKENDVYKREEEKRFSKEEVITFKHPTPSSFQKADYDWYIIVALEKADKVTSNRSQLTRELLLSYRWAIREGYQHQLDPAIRNPYDQPRNKNTIEGIKGYIEKIQKASEKES